MSCLLLTKKPTFWLIVISVVAVLTVGMGVMVNPLSDNTKMNSINHEQIADVAWEVINRDINNYESNSEVNFINSKITLLELVKSFNGLADTPIDVYALEYRLLPEDLSKVVLAGGMQIDEDGWLKETSSMGSPLLVVSRKIDSVKFIGIVWTGGMNEDGGLEFSVKALLKSNYENERK